MALIVSIAYTPAHLERRPADRYARVPVEQARLVANQGIEGDMKATAGKRQLNVMRAEEVEQLRAEGLSTAPGELGEQLVIAGLDARSLRPGVRIAVGESAVLELGTLRTPCKRFSHIQRVPIVDAVGRIGFMARVVESGDVSVGSEVTVAAR